MATLTRAVSMVPAGPGVTGMVLKVHQDKVEVARYHGEEGAESWNNIEVFGRRIGRPRGRAGRRGARRRWRRPRTAKLVGAVEQAEGGLSVEMFIILFYFKVCLFKGGGRGF